MLASVYSYRVMVKSVSSCCVCGRWVLSNPVTYAYVTNIIYNYTCLTGPSALKVTTTRNKGDLSVVVQWDEVDDSLNTTYIVTWTNGTNSTQSLTLLEQSPYTLTGLTLDTVYNITVTATNKCGNRSEYKTNVSFPTGMCHHHYLLTICSN